MNPVLSIIIISYNTSKITIDCLKSILKDKGLEFDLRNPKDDHKIPTEIIVIDNASTDNSPSIVGATLAVARYKGGHNELYIL